MSHTGNPRHPDNPPSDYPAEPTGPVAKDSLANESRVRGQGFSENENAASLGVKGYQSTLANEDTSNAEVLPPARSGAEREGQESTRYPDADAGSGFSGTHSDQGYRGGSGDVSVGETRTTGHSGSSVPSGTGSRPYVESAPGYTADTTGDAYTSGDLKPKGTNLVEGGDIPENRDTYVGDIGGSNDPGRLAEREFAKTTADSSGGTGARSYQTGGRKGDGTIYDELDSRERA